MLTRRLGKTDLELPSSVSVLHRWVPSFAVFRLMKYLLDTSRLELGMNFIDTSPFYGRGIERSVAGCCSEERSTIELHDLH